MNLESVYIVRILLDKSFLKINFMFTSASLREFAEERRQMGNLMHDLV